MHGSLWNLLRPVVQENLSDWDTRIKFVVSAYNSTLHTGIGLTPFFAMFHREYQVPQDFLRSRTPDSNEDGDTGVQRGLKRMKKAYKQIDQQKRRVDEDIEQRYPETVRTIPVGAWVLATLRPGCLAGG